MSGAGSGRLLEILREEVRRLRPVPPPLSIRAGGEGERTFSVDLKSMTVTAPPDWEKFSEASARAYIAHELKHASSDGLPHTHMQYIRLLCQLMSLNREPRDRIAEALNCAYDICVDRRVSRYHDVKASQEEWLQHFPITQELIGTPYHLLNIVYKDLFGISGVPESDYERSIRGGIDYKILIRTASSEEISTPVGALRAASAFLALTKSGHTPAPGAGDVRVPVKGLEQEYLEAAAEAGLSPQRTAELLGCQLDQLDQLVEEAARKALWKGVCAARGVGSSYSIEELCTVKWRPWSRAVDPGSTAAHPSDPERWRAPAKISTVPAHQDGGDAGAEHIVVALDVSNSTRDVYGERTKLAYEKDAAVGLIALAKLHGLPVEVIIFSDDAQKVPCGPKDYLSLTKRVLVQRPRGGTYPDSIIPWLRRCHPGSVIAIITDGEFCPEMLKSVADSVRRTKVICAVVNPHASEACGVRVRAENLEIFEVRPSHGMVIVERARDHLR